MCTDFLYPHTIRHHVHQFVSHLPARDSFHNVLFSRGRSLASSPNSRSPTTLLVQISFCEVSRLYIPPCIHSYTRVLMLVSRVSVSMGIEKASLRRSTGNRRSHSWARKSKILNKTSAAGLAGTLNAIFLQLQMLLQPLLSMPRICFVDRRYRYPYTRKQIHILTLLALLYSRL